MGMRSKASKSKQQSVRNTEEKIEQKVTCTWDIKERDYMQPIKIISRTLNKEDDTTKNFIGYKE